AFLTEYSSGEWAEAPNAETIRQAISRQMGDSYAFETAIVDGWPAGFGPSDDYQNATIWPVHCYGMIGVARGLSPETGSGSDLYAVIGHAPRQLDRNIALVGRVIEGIEHLSSLPRGKGQLGFYDEGEEAKRVPVLSVRLMSELASISEAEDQQGLPRYEYLSTESDSFAAYVHARANRNDDFYKVPSGGVDICNAPVPVRRVPGE
ncbi:MAG TPA: peptidylprolyl isomerase, partial [Sphingomonadaceae bacterium]|nr:peptidylprolyl isomerase [Sphingomonadaceae bacterium]